MIVCPSVISLWQARSTGVRCSFLESRPRMSMHWSAACHSYSTSPIHLDRIKKQCPNAFASSENFLRAFGDLAQDKYVESMEPCFYHHVCFSDTDDFSAVHTCPQSMHKSVTCLEGHRGKGPEDFTSFPRWKQKHGSSALK